MVNRIRAIAARFDRRVLLGGAAGLAALGLLYAAIGFFVLPGVIKSKAEQLLPAKINRAVQISQLKVNPFALSVTARDVRILEPDGSSEFASIKEAYLNLSITSLFRVAPVVEELRITEPHVRLVRFGSNRYNIDDLVDMALKPKEDKEPARFSLHNIQIEDGKIEFDDRPKKARHVVDELKLGIPFVSSLPSQADIFVEPLLSARVNGTPLLVKGKTRPFAEQKDGAVELQLDGIELPHYMDYLPFKPRFKLPQGKLNLDLVLNFAQPKEAALAVVIEGGASLKSLLLTELDGTPMVRLHSLDISGLSANLSSGRHHIRQIELVKPEIHVVKDAAGTLNLARIAPETRESPASAPAKANDGAPDMLVQLERFAIKDGSASYRDMRDAAETKAAVDKLDLVIGKAAFDLRKREIDIGQVDSPDAAVSLVHGKRGEGPAAPVLEKSKVAENSDAGYVFRIGKLAIHGWSVQVEDRGQAQPAVTRASPLAATLTGLSNVSGSKGELDLRATVNQSGHLSAKGSVGIAPMLADLELDLKEVDILAVQPYVADRINLIIRRANLSSQGRLQLARPAGSELKGGFVGDVTVGDLATVDRISGNEFLRWKRLSATGINAQLSPFSLTTSQMVLSDFFARVIISREGRINLQDIVRQGAGRQRSLTEEGDEAPAQAEKAETDAAPATKMPPVRIGKFVMQNGRARFTDNFIQPNYSAMLSSLNGTVSELSSDTSTAAKVDVRGQVSGAPLTISGRVNPLAGNLFLDINASVSGMELAPLSAYSAKYAGYGIEKGKLSFDVAYQIENRQLTAQNRLVLDQLELGDQVDSPNATKLPVRLALSLLKDRNGVIDLELPISGSLNDPQFSVGGLLVRAFVNVLVKVATSPFSLISSIFGRGEELSWLEFDSGSRMVGDAGKSKLEPIAKALTDRPQLHLEITGRFDPAADKEGLGRVAIQRKVRMLKRQDLEKQGRSVDIASVTVQPAEYAALLKRVYADEKFPKPRNLIGLQKNLSVEEMEKLIIANSKVEEDDLIALANQRAQSVKDWLTTTGQVQASRIFILAGKSGAEHKSAKASRVDFSLR